MHALIASFMKSLPALPLLLAALYLLSIVGVTGARDLAFHMLRLRIVLTLFLSTSCLMQLLLV